MASGPRALRLRPEDAVAVACIPLDAGSVPELGGRTVRVSQDVPAGHKIAVAPIPEGGEVVKYGQVIGLATCDIVPGEHVTRTISLSPPSSGTMHFALISRQPM